jgi:Cu/Ag efflux protein CusF
VNSDVTVVAIDAAASASAQFSVRGTLESVEPGDSSLTLNIDDETVSYYVADTAKVARNKLSATLVDLLEGDKVDAIIRVSADDSETVVAINASGRRVTERTVSLNGEISAIDLGAGKIWLGNENGDDTELVVSDATAIRAGDEDATIDDLSPGDRVRVVARQRGATFTALTIRIAPTRRIEVEVTVSSVDLDESTVLLAIDGRGEDLAVSVTEASELAVDGTPVSLEELAAMDSIAGQAVLIRRGAWWTLESLDASSYVEPDNGETCDPSVDSSCEPVVDPGCDVETDASCEPSEDPVAEAAELG